MRLLVITQKVDRNDDVLGFFHGWIEEFAPRFSGVVVVALEVGDHHLPQNVTVHSLGKERNQGRLAYVVNFYRYLWAERKNYDAVFVHMNQEYVLLGSLFWKWQGKKTALWRNHYAGGLFTRFAALLADKTFCTSQYSFIARYKKTVLMPVGVDTSVFSFSKTDTRIPRSVLSLARIAPAKNIHVIVSALERLSSQGTPFSASFYGAPAVSDHAYAAALKQRIEGNLQGRAVWKGALPHKATSELYRTHHVFVNASPSGMYDKTLFEAMASGCLVVASSKDLGREVGEWVTFREGDVAHLAEKIEEMISFTDKEIMARGEKLRDFVVTRHSLKKLGEELVRQYSV